MSRSDLQSLVDNLTEPSAPDTSRLTLGHPSTDHRLGGGLAQAALHEVFAAQDADAPAAAGFALLMALRSERKGPLVWLREDKGRMNGRLYGLGLHELGFDPDRLLLVEAPDTISLLRAAAEAVQCTAVGAVIIEPWGKASVVDLTATRRLTLAAARSGVLALLLRTGEPGPSAATSRWGVRAIPSAQLPADAPGAPAFEISLLRHRSGIAGFSARVEWNRDTCVFTDLADPAAAPVAAAPLPGVVPATAVVGTNHPLPHPVLTRKQRTA